MVEISYTTLAQLQLSQKLVDHINALLHELTPRAYVMMLADLEDIVLQPQVTVILAQDADDVIGMIVGVIAKTPLRKIMYIEETVVSPSHRGQGIGKQLTMKVLELAKAEGVKEIDLTSNAAATTAIKLYESLGFTKRETNFYRLVI